MSASREKKQRQEAGPSEKLSQQQAEKAAYKKKARIYTVIGCVLVVLVAALLTWNSGIFQRGATAATIGDTELSTGQLSYYYYSTRQVYAMYGLIDANKDDDEQIFNSSTGETYQDFFLEAALTSAQSVEALYTEALANGYSDADVKDDVDATIENAKTAAVSSGYSSYASYLVANYGRYVTPSIFEEMLTRDILSNKYYNDKYTEEHDALTSADLDAYYEENADSVDQFTYSYLYFKADAVETKDEDGNELSDEEVEALEKQAMEAAKSKADKALEQFNNGTAVSAIIANNSPSSSVERTTVTGSGSISSVFRDELLKLEADAATVVENEDAGYYVVIFHSRARDEHLLSDMRHILFRAATTTTSSGTIVEPTEEAWTSALEKAEAALDSYNNSDKTPEAFGLLAADSDDAGSNTNGGLYTGVREGGFSSSEVNDWLYHDETERQPGDVAIIQHKGDVSSSSPYWGYHVVYFQGWGEEASWQADVRDAMASEAVSEWEEGIMENYKAELADGAYNLGK